MQEPRFICVLDPFDLWMVWDEQAGLPAEGAGSLVGLSEAAARSACRRLNLGQVLEPADAPAEILPSPRRA